MHELCGADLRAASFRLSTIEDVGQMKKCPRNTPGCLYGRHLARICHAADEILDYCRIAAAQMVNAELGLHGNAQANAQDSGGERWQTSSPQRFALARPTYPHIYSLSKAYQSHRAADNTQRYHAAPQ